MASDARIFEASLKPPLTLPAAISRVMEQVGSDPMMLISLRDGEVDRWTDLSAFHKLILRLGGINPLQLFDQFIENTIGREFIEETYKDITYALAQSTSVRSLF